MADILIRGMEMPKNCTECPCFSQWDDCGINHEWKFADEFDKTKDRLPSCPLGPLPEKHGRLGDLDKLEDAFIRYYLEQERNNNLVFAAVEIKQRIADMMGDWPTIVPAEGGRKMENNICFNCKHVSKYPECPATNDDIVFASNGDTIVRCKAYEEAEGGTDNG